MWLSCPECRDDSPFEQPPCEDGHGHDCPEWFCVSCGFAVLAGEAQAGLIEVAKPVTGRPSSKPHAA